MSASPVASELRLLTNASTIPEIVQSWRSNSQAAKDPVGRLEVDDTKGKGTLLEALSDKATDEDWKRGLEALESHIEKEKLTTPDGTMAVMVDPQAPLRFWTFSLGKDWTNSIRCHYLGLSDKHLDDKQKPDGYKLDWQWRESASMLSGHKDVSCWNKALDVLVDHNGRLKKRPKAKEIRRSESEHLSPLANSDSLQAVFEEAFATATARPLAQTSPGVGKAQAREMWDAFDKGAEKGLLGPLLTCWLTQTPSVVSILPPTKWKYGTQEDWLKGGTERSDKNTLAGASCSSDWRKSLGNGDCVHTWSPEHPGIVFTVSKPNSKGERTLKVTLGWDAHEGKPLVRTFEKTFRPDEEVPLEPLLEQLVSDPKVSHKIPEESHHDPDLTDRSRSFLKRTLRSPPTKRKMTTLEPDTLKWVYGTERQWKDSVSRNPEAEFARAPNFESLLRDPQERQSDNTSQQRRDPWYTWSEQAPNMTYLVWPGDAQQRRSLEYREWGRNPETGKCFYGWHRRQIEADKTVPLKELLSDLQSSNGWLFSWNGTRPGLASGNREQYRFLKRTRKHPPDTASMIPPDHVQESEGDVAGASAATPENPRVPVY